MTTLPFKCEICGREGQPASFKRCPECNRLIGSECWQPKYQREYLEIPAYPNCRHRLVAAKPDKRIRIDP